MVTFLTPARAAAHPLCYPVRFGTSRLLPCYADLYIRRGQMPFWVRRILLAAGAGALTVILIGPWVLYAVALSNVVGRPSRTDASALSSADAEAVWRSLREHGPVTVEPLTPHGYLFSLWMENPLPSGAHVAWLVAREHNFNNLKDRRMIWWHLSGAVLTVWLTRNWSTGQLVAKAREIRRSSRPAFNPGVNTDP